MSWCYISVFVCYGKKCVWMNNLIVFKIKGNSNVTAFWIRCKNDVIFCDYWSTRFFYLVQ